MSNKQIAALAYIAANPGCTTMDVCRAEWSGRGHRASYDRVGRLWARGLVARMIGPSRGPGIPLALTAAGLAALESAS